MARASEQEQKGSTGVSEVTAKFTRLEWGFAEITRHDNGSDPFLMARDARRFDLGLTVGAQVKAGPWYFKEEAHAEDGRLQGWWFRDPDGEHVNDWLKHGLPHLIVIHNLDTLMTYWVHVTEDAVVSTGKGSKVLVPIENTVDEKHRDALLAVAATLRPAPMWEGSAWKGVGSLSSKDVLRHALMVPRLIAPHPNAAVSEGITPAQGVALLMQARLRDLDELSSKHEQVPTLLEAMRSSEWSWRFFGALGQRICSGDVDILQSSLDDAPDPAARVAAVVTAAAGLLEEDRPDEAIALLEAALDTDEADPVDHAWLTVQHARALAEVGRLDEARGEAASVQSLRATQPHDVTATAIAGVGALLLFSISDWGEGDLANAVVGADTAASWWRQQTSAWGLAAGLERTFQGWARDTTLRWSVSDEAHDQLLAAALTATLSGAQGEWRNLSGLLGRDTLLRVQRTTDATVAQAGLSTLRLAGAKEALQLAVHRLVADGPAAAVTAAAAEVHLDASTKTTGPTNLTLLRYGGRVLDEATADGALRWLLATLIDPVPFTDRTTPSYMVPLLLVETLAGVVQASSAGARRSVVAHILELPPQGDQLIAQSWAEVVLLLGSEWDAAAGQAAGLCASTHHDALKFSLLRVASVHDPDVRKQLLDSVRTGSLAALNAFGDVRELPPDVAVALIHMLARSLQKQITDAHAHAFGLGGSDVGREITLLNLWHPASADWEQLLAYLGDEMVNGGDKQGALQLLATLVDRVPVAQRARLVEIVAIIGSSQQSPPAGLFGPVQDAYGAAAVLGVALDGLSESDYGGMLQRLLAGATDQRTWAARVARLRGHPEDTGVLLTLIHDIEPDVRASAAEGLALLVAAGRGGPLAEAGLRHCLQDPGIRVPMAVARGLASTPTSNSVAQAALEILIGHAYAPVRRIASTHSEMP